MLTDNSIPSDLEEIEVNSPPKNTRRVLHDEDKEASRFGNEEVSEHDDFDRNRDDAKDDDDNDNH